MPQAPSESHDVAPGRPVGNDGPPATYAEWRRFFLPEGRECVRLRQAAGQNVTDPDRDTLTYAGFCAFDAIHKGPAFQRLDFGRAREIAAQMTRKAARAAGERVAA